MKPRDRAAAKGRRPGGSKPSRKKGSAAKTIAATKKIAPLRTAVSVKKPAPVKKPVARKPELKPVAKPVPVAVPAKPMVAAPRPQPAAVAPPPSKPAVAPPPPRPVAAAKPATASDSAARLASAQQAEERRKAATRKLFARLRSLEAIVGADLRKRGSLLLSQAVDQWYAEAISATASDVTITNAARAVIAQL
ncbi:MAG TPA: hypothetical protein VFA22_11035 [Stellaceae bacterium]|nr:hypothetical protein [Stellaceae bacterium]